MEGRAHERAARVALEAQRAAREQPRDDQCDAPAPRYANASPAPTSADGSKRAKLKNVTTGRITQRLTHSIRSAIAVASGRRRAASTPAADPAKMTAATASTAAG